jgi:type IV pilus assembly protein PilA
MLCSKCGAQVTELTKFCSNCGALTTDAQGSTLSAAAAPPPPYAGPEQTSGKAIASLVCGIINIFPLSVVAIILGHISVSEIAKSAGRLKGRGLAITGLVLGYLGVVAIPFILILAAIAIPNLLRAKISANEASAVGSMRNLLTAEVMYQTNNSKAGYTCNLSDLTGLDSNLAAGQKHGYTFAIQNCKSDQPDGPVTSFQMIATPVTRNATGAQAFCADESGVIKFDRRGSAEDCLQSGEKLE